MNLFIKSYHFEHKSFIEPDSNAIDYQWNNAAVSGSKGHGQCPEEQYITRHAMHSIRVCYMRLFIL